MARNPIVFSNGTLVSNAKVNVGGTIYDVEPAQYEGTTPLSASNLNQLQTNLYDYVDAMINVLYPIGSYYETSDDSFDPNVSWGGTWVLDSQGRVTVSQNTSDTDFDTIGETGGSKDLQEHTHDYKGYKANGMAFNGSAQYPGTAYATGASVVSMGGYVASAGTGDSGNLQPYVVVKRWHRTA